MKCIICGKESNLSICHDCDSEYDTDELETIMPTLLREISHK